MITQIERQITQITSNLGVYEFQSCRGLINVRVQ